MTARALMPVLVGDRFDLVEFDAPTDLSGPLTPIGVKSDDIRAWVEHRKPLAINRWNDIGSEEHARSFAVARTAGQDIIGDLYSAFQATVADGGTEVDFERLVMPTLKAKGWLPDASEDHVANRVRLIYDTNLRLARASGRWTRYQASRAALPYLRGVTGRDERVRHPPKSPDSDHRAWEGIVLPVDHPFWRRWWTPLGFRCRCNIIQMSRSQLARAGLGVTSEDDLAEREARLGTPIFAAPGAGIMPQLASMAEQSNEDMVPGSPPMLPTVMRTQGSNIWAALLLDEFVKRILGD
jgi:hypothetical protein